ncbi:hypothetical protein ACFVKB_37310 [Rhodococcus sp. NPDC127530]|uniref:hypothetical protein n=1 Tax=unclassified Rhodococcus (in: high G+C Gram-positive bacteria) TaxID=192944 RepID=UPI00362ABB55
MARAAAFAAHIPFEPGPAMTFRDIGCFLSAPGFAEYVADMRFLHLIEADGSRGRRAASVPGFLADG